MKTLPTGMLGSMATSPATPSKLMVISYSSTGNNEGLATSLATALAADHLRISEPRSKPRTMATIMLDLIFKRTPKIRMPAAKTEEYDLVLFVGPVWIGQIATPFRACFKQLGQKISKYAFVTVSGGADGPNLKLAGELRQRLQKEPACVIDLHIADLLPAQPKPTRKITMAYRLNENEVKHMTDSAVTTLQRAFASA